MTIRCEIVSQDRTVFEGDVDIVVLPGGAGEMGVLPHHAPVLTTLKYGVVKVRRGGKEEIFAVTVLADAAENVNEIDIARAEAAKERAVEALARSKSKGPDVLLNIEAALRRSNLRLDVVRRYRGAGGHTPISEK
jgi:F-type H+-transporting ATPase subunit epsilon